MYGGLITETILTYKIRNKNDNETLILKQEFHFLISFPGIIFHNCLSYPVSQGLAVIRNHQTFLVQGILHITKLHKHCDRSSILQNIKITLAYCSTKSSTRLMFSVFTFECLLNFCCKTFAVFAVRGMVKYTSVCLLLERLST